MLGTVLSILFLVWFLSGMVMMYHSYPKVSLCVPPGDSRGQTPCSGSLA